MSVLFMLFQAVVAAGIMLVLFLNLKLILALWVSTLAQLHCSTCYVEYACHTTWCTLYHEHLSYAFVNLSV